MELLTVTQLVRVRGGKCAIKLDGKRCKVEINVGSVCFTGETGIDLEGVAAIEECFDSLGHDVASMAPAAAGLTRFWLKKNFPGKDIVECHRIARDFATEEADKQCAQGFYHDVAEGTVYDMIDGNKFRIYTAEDERQQHLMQLLIDEDSLEGEWDGKRFIMPGDDVECTCAERILLLVAAWEEAKEVALTSEDVKGPIHSEEGDAWTDCDSAETRFFKLRTQSLTSWEKSVRDELYWAGGKPMGKSQSVGARIFPLGKMKFADFMEQAQNNALKKWNYDEKQKIHGFRSLEDFVLGQMLRIGGQFIVDEKERTVVYLAKPEAYLQSQKGVAGLKDL